jgi:hypothetical protein
LVAVLLAPLATHAQSDRQVVVDRADGAVADMRHDKAFGNARPVDAKRAGPC